MLGQPLTEEEEGEEEEEDSRIPFLRRRAFSAGGRAAIFMTRGRLVITIIIISYFGVS